MCEVTRAPRNGQTGPLPEGAAGWLVRSWGPDLSPAERWAARDRLVRIEQLAAACKAHGGRAGTQDDPLLAHLVIPHTGPHEDDEVVYVAAHRPPQFVGHGAESPDDGHQLPRHV
jgi:hypothetical protein